MKTILIPVEPSPLLDSILQTAWLLGSAFGSYLEGFALGPVLSPFLGADAIGGAVVYDADLRQDDATVQESRKAFEQAMTERSKQPAPGRAPTFGWLKDASQGDGFVGAYGRVFDVTVVGKPGSTAESPRMSTFEAALFDAGRPVVIAPPSPPAKLGEVVTVAWNRSAETARTVAFAMPLLERAKTVEVLSVEGSQVPGPSAEEMATLLRRHGIPTTARHVGQRGRMTPGEMVLAEAKSVGADLLIKGAYTQSRLRQMIFGGTTRHIIMEAELPVILAH